MSGLGLFRLHPGFRRGSSSSDEDSPPRPPPNPHRVKRALFGPTDHEENLRFVRNEMKKAKNEAASKWNFDFDKGTPLKGRFSWEEANPAEVHAVYNLERLPYLSTHSESETKENRVSKSQDSSPVQNPLAEPAGSIDDLRTPQQGPSQPLLSPSSPETTEQPPPSELGARPKDKNAKEKKLTGKLFSVFKCEECEPWNFVCILSYQSMLENFQAMLYSDLFFPIFIKWHINCIKSGFI